MRALFTVQKVMANFYPIQLDINHTGLFRIPGHWLFSRCSHGVISKIGQALKNIILIPDPISQAFHSHNTGVTKALTWKEFKSKLLGIFCNWSTLIIL